MVGYTSPTDERVEILKPYRKLLFGIPQDRAFELPGKPHVTYELRDYHAEHKGSRLARDELGFLFKAFETGQARPPRPGTAQAKAPRAATIHEFLDWTVQGNPPTENEAWKSYPQDFDGFIVICMMQRWRPNWPSPGHFDIELNYPSSKLGAPSPPIPYLITKGKPLVAATLRAGPGFIEVPFFATVEHRKGRGYGRCLLEAIEEICRAVNIDKIMLCSENIDRTRNIWQRMGFQVTQDKDWEGLGVKPEDMLHMDNTIQMHKFVPPRKPWRSIVIKHQHFKQRVYCPWPPGAAGTGGAAAIPPTSALRSRPSFSHLSGSEPPQLSTQPGSINGFGDDDEMDVDDTQNNNSSWFGGGVLPSKMAPGGKAPTGRPFTSHLHPGMAGGTSDEGGGNRGGVAGVGPGVAPGLPGGSRTPPNLSTYVGMGGSGSGEGAPRQPPFLPLSGPPVKQDPGGDWLFGQGGRPGLPGSGSGVGAGPGGGTQQRQPPPPPPPPEPAIPMPSFD